MLRFLAYFCTEYAKWRTKSFNGANILPLSLHIFSSGIVAKPVNHAFLPDRGAFLNLRPSGFPSHSSRYDSCQTVWQRSHTALWFLTLYLDICNTESTVESWVVTGNKGSRRRIAWTTGQYLVCMLMTRSPGCPNHVFSFKNLGPFLTMCTVISLWELKHAPCNSLELFYVNRRVVDSSLNDKYLHFEPSSQECNTQFSHSV